MKLADKATIAHWRAEADEYDRRAQAALDEAAGTYMKGSAG